MEKVGNYKFKESKNDVSFLGYFEACFRKVWFNIVPEENIQS